MSAMHSPKFHKKEDPGQEYIFVQGVGFLKMSPERQEMASLRHASMVMGLAIAVCLFCMMLLPGFFAKVLFAKASMQSYESNRFYLQVAGALGYLASLIVPVAIIRLFLRLPRACVFPHQKLDCKMLLMAVCCALGLSVIGSAVSSFVSQILTFLGFAPHAPQVAVPETVGEALVFAVRLVVIPAFAEEMLFRGAVLQSLRRFGDAFALFASSILFALLHGNVTQIPNAFLMGLVMGYFVLRTGCLRTSICMHFLNNLLVLAMMLVAYFWPLQASYVQAGMQILYLLLATAACLWLLKRDKKIFTLCPSSSPLKEGKKYGIFFTSIPMLMCLTMMGMMTVQNML